MKYRVHVTYPYGHITFDIEASYFGEGTVEEGIIAMLTPAYPEALNIDLFEKETDD